MTENYADEIAYRLAQPIFRDFRPYVTPEGYSPQVEFLRAQGTHRVVVLRGGNRSGKTSCGGVNVALLVLGWHPFARHKPPVKVWCVGLDWNTIATILWPAIAKWIPKDQINMPACKWERLAEPSTPLLITLRNGSTIEFKSAEARVDKFSGAKVHFVWIDEEVTRELVQEIRMRLVDLSGNLALTLTPVQRKLWVKDLEEERYADGRPVTKLIRASMRDAARAGVIPLEDVDLVLRSLPERDRQVRELGEFAAFEGAVYPDYRRDVHVLRPRGNELVSASGVARYPWPLPAEWDRYAAMDFGFGVPGCILLVAHDPTRDALIVERCWHAANVTIDKWVGIARQLPKLTYPLVCDHDAGDREMLHANGVPTVPAPKHPSDAESGVREGITFVGRRLTLASDELPRLYFVVYHDRDAWPSDRITGRCDAIALEREIQGYHYEARKKEDARDQPDRPFKANDHALDALRYLVRYVDARGKRSIFDDMSKLVGPKPLGGAGFSSIVPPKPAR